VTQNAQSDGRIIELDGLRAIAVLAVIVDHVCVFSLDGSGRFGGFAFSVGLAGVRYFFVLSGFVILRGLLHENEATGRISLGGFWIRRCSRILPAFWTYLLAVWLLGVSRIIHTDLHSLMWSALLVANVVHVDWFHRHIWSLSVEEQFYVLGPLITLVILRRRRGSVAFVLGSIYLGCLFWQRVEREFAALHIPASLEFLSMFRFICAGVMLGFSHRNFAGLFRRVPGVLVAAVALLTVFLPESPANHWAQICCQGLQPLGIAGVVGWIALERDRCRWLCWPILQWLGRRSYSLYLWQQLYLGPSQLFGFAVNGIVKTFALTLVFASGALSYRFVEKPVIALGRRVAVRLR
jgi:peptidoglycan/LPS O-acetylase OafA/YrhL